MSISISLMVEDHTNQPHEFAASDGVGRRYPERRIRHHRAMADCLYRSKEHGKWLLPTLDIDEFFHFRKERPGGLLAERQADVFDRTIPLDYFKTGWDAILSHAGVFPHHAEETWSEESASKTCTAFSSSCIASNAQGRSYRSLPSCDRRPANMPM